MNDSRDKHANMESAYLLQRMESFDGIAVLTTNLRANLDEAFTRRLDVIAEFPMPDARQRLALWDRCLGPAIPRDATLDLEFCADRFELAGGSIRACAVTAAYLAAESGAPLTMDQPCHGGAPGVPQAGAAGAGERVRPVAGEGSGAGDGSPERGAVSLPAAFSGPRHRDRPPAVASSARTSTVRSISASVL